MAHRASVNQVVQIGPEVTPGTIVPAGKLLTAFTWAMGAKTSTKQFTGTGRKYPSASELLTEYSTGKVSGQGDFNGLAYLISSCFGKVTAVAHAGASTAFDWKYAPALSGAYSPQTYTIQNGDVNDAEQYAYGIFSGWGYSFTRKQEFAITGDFFAQTFTDGATLTASPTEVALLPMTGAQANIYLDSTSAGIGVTQLVNPMSVAFAASNYYGQFWPINRANASFTSHIDLMPKNELKVKLEADTAGIAIRGNYLEAGAKCYVRMNATGALIENDQTVGVGAATAGNFTLTYKGQTTGNIAFNATAGVVATAIGGLSTVGAANVSVSGTAPTWTVLFKGALANDTTLLTGSGAGLTGGALTITAAPVNAIMTHDMACFVSDIAEFSDADGAFAVEYTLQVAEDVAWSTGQSQVLTLTNLINAL